MAGHEMPDYVPLSEQVIESFTVIDAARIPAGVIAFVSKTDSVVNEPHSTSTSNRYFLFNMDQGGNLLEGYGLLTNITVDGDGLDMGLDGYRLTEAYWAAENPSNGVRSEDREMSGIQCFVPVSNDETGEFETTVVHQEFEKLTEHEIEALQMNVRAGYVPVSDLNDAYKSQSVFEIPGHGHVFYFGEYDKFYHGQYDDKQIVHVQNGNAELRGFRILSQDEAEARNIPYEEGYTGYMEGLGSIRLIRGEGYKFYGDDGSVLDAVQIYPTEHALAGDNALESDIMGLVNNPTPKSPCPGTM